jgi:hypothetical protein
MGQGRLVVLVSLLGTGCFVVANPNPAKPVDPNRPPPRHEANRCEGVRHPVDPLARERLVQLERRLVASVLEDAPCVDDLRAPEVCSMTAELHKMLRQFPDAEMVFLFPEPVTIPDSPYRAHLGNSTAALQKVDHAVFFLELSRVHMVGTAGKGALVANVFSGPSGATPANVIWLWGGYGERCFVPRPDGTWAHYTIGLQAISQQSDDEPGPSLSRN